MVFGGFEHDDLTYVSRSTENYHFQEWVEVSAQSHISKNGNRQHAKLPKSYP